MKTVKQTQKDTTTMEKAYNDFATFSQDNIDAFVRANAAFTKGFEQISKHFVTLATRSVEEAVENSKRFAGIKSIQEAFELQTKLAQETIETVISESKKVQELSASVMKDATAPLAERFKQTVATATVSPVATTKKAA